MNRPRAARSLSDLIRPALTDALKAQGLASGDILRLWPEIAGERLAARSIPVRIVWPPRPKGAPEDAPPMPATLILKVESAFAWEAEMAAAQIIARVNGVFGWRCIGQLRLRQGPVEIKTPRALKTPKPLDPEHEKRLGRSLETIDDEGLRRSLEKLGRAVLAGRPVTQA